MAVAVVGATAPSRSRSGRRPGDRPSGRWRRPPLRRAPRLTHWDGHECRGDESTRQRFRCRDRNATSSNTWTTASSRRWFSAATASPRSCRARAAAAAASVLARSRCCRSGPRPRPARQEGRRPRSPRYSRTGDNSATRDSGSPTTINDRVDRGDTGSAAVTISQHLPADHRAHLGGHAGTAYTTARLDSSRAPGSIPTSLASSAFTQWPGKRANAARDVVRGRPQPSCHEDGAGSLQAMLDGPHERQRRREQWWPRRPEDPPR